MASVADSQTRLIWAELSECDELKGCSSDDAASICSTTSGIVEGDVACSEDLLSENDYSSESSSEADALIIFDWDDTLFPTSWLHKNELLVAEPVLTQQQEDQLQALADNARLTLQSAIQLGKVVIVTNAEQGWIERSCTKFMPSLVSMLQTVDIVSARSHYESQTQSPSNWKRLAFEQEVDLFYGSSQSSRHRNIVSIGDSLHELTALKAVTEDLANCSGKSVKLMEAPSIEQLIEQHYVLSSSIFDVVEHSGDLDIEIGADA